MEKTRNVAVVTGAASGIGLAITTQCLERGFDVVMADIDVAQLCDKVEQLTQHYSSEIRGVVTDVCKYASVNQLAQQTIEQFGTVDYLFNNAGICGQLAPVWDLPIEHIQSVLDVNLFGVLHGVKAFMPHLLRQETPSRIINMASMYGLCSGSHLAAYSMSKSAIVSLSESMYFDLQRTQSMVRVSVVCPSFADTNLLSNSSPIKEDALHDTLTDLLSHSRPAADVAKSILRGVDNDHFYILPDQEVKSYCEGRNKSITEQSTPHCHNIEKIIQAFLKRTDQQETEGLV